MSESAAGQHWQQWVQQQQQQQQSQSTSRWIALTWYFRVLPLLLLLQCSGVRVQR
jgi:hypothetical protein